MRGMAPRLTPRACPSMCSCVRARGRAFFFFIDDDRDALDASVEIAAFSQTELEGDLNICCIVYAAAFCCNLQPRYSAAASGVPFHSARQTVLFAVVVVVLQALHAEHR